MDTSTENSIKSSLIGAGGAGLGAGAMYFSDPDRGRYRRALVRDRFIHWGNIAKKQGRIAWLDFTHRTRGQVAEFRGRLFPHEVTDDVLVARVAAQLGRLVSMPHPIELTAEDGTVIMSGPIFSDEIDQVVEGVTRVAGVKQIVNKMQIRERSEKDPARRTFYGRKQWPPSTKLLVSVGSTLFSAGAAWLVLKNRNDTEEEDTTTMELSDESLVA